MSGPHSAGDVIDSRYKILQFIGEGGMQFVYLAEDLILERQVALKTPKNPSALKRFQRSAIVAAKVNHPNVAKTLDYFETFDAPYLIEELVLGSDLKKALLDVADCLDPYLVAKIFHYLVKGLAASHHVGVVHRDLKPANIMVEGNFQIAAIKITDFGIARMADEELAEAAEGGDMTISQSSTAIGALPYMAPEAIETPREVGIEADIWSIGAMLYELMTGQRPFGSGLKAVSKIMAAEPPEFPPLLTSNPQFAPLSRQLISIVLVCLQKSPGSRPKADELVERCGELYYPTIERFTGKVRDVRHNSWGFIAGSEEDVFFHYNSVYGPKPKIGDSVLFSKFPGGGAWRAHPVVKLPQ